MPKIINLFEELEYCYTYSNFLDTDGLVFRKSMAKYPKKAQVKIKENLHAMKQGRLEIGSGHTVTNPKQAIAIGLSEVRKGGAKVPENKK